MELILPVVIRNSGGESRRRRKSSGLGLTNKLLLKGKPSWQYLLDHCDITWHWSAHSGNTYRQESVSTRRMGTPRFGKHQFDVDITFGFPRDVSSNKYGPSKDMYGMLSVYQVMRYPDNGGLSEHRIFCEKFEYANVLTDLLKPDMLKGLVHMIAIQNGWFE